jgi:histidyl-tRNA synthetase
MSPGDKNSLRPPRGMRDFYPDEMDTRRAIFDAWRTASEHYAFRQYDSCVVESLDLLKRKAGEEIVEQVYAFKDKNDRDLALRPEMTPSLARMVAARQGELSFPLKWFSIPQCFRYERTTRGRKREHYQWNLDVIGEPAVSAEAEVIAAAVYALSLLGIAPGDFRVRINNRALLGEILDKVGIPGNHHSAAFLALDKKGKIPDHEVRELLEKEGVESSRVDSVFEVLNMSSLDDAANVVASGSESCRLLYDLFALLDAHGVGDSMVFDVSVVRGLAYYTGIVFEAFDSEGKFRAIFGGGRYDNLLRDVGGRPMTGVGLGFGDVVITEILRSKSSGPAMPGYAARTAVGFMEERQRDTAVRISTFLRRRGQSVDMALSPQKAKPFFSAAAKKGCAEAVFVGPDDVGDGKVRVKDLATRTEIEVPLSEMGVVGG